jgi:hypothetical protein
MPPTCAPTVGGNSEDLTGSAKPQPSRRSTRSRTPGPRNVPFTRPAIPPMRPPNAPTSTTNGTPNQAPTIPAAVPRRFRPTMPAATPDGQRRRRTTRGRASSPQLLAQRHRRLGPAERRVVHRRVPEVVRRSDQWRSEHLRHEDLDPSPAPSLVDRALREFVIVALSPEQPPVRRQAEGVDVGMNERGQLRWTRGIPGVAALSLLKLSAVTVLAAVGPLLAGVWLGPVEVQPAPPSVRQIKVTLVQRGRLLRPEPGVVQAPVERHEPRAAPLQVSDRVQQGPRLHPGWRPIDGQPCAPPWASST